MQKIEYLRVVDYQSKDGEMTVKVLFKGDSQELFKIFGIGSATFEAIDSGGRKIQQGATYSFEIKNAKTIQEAFQNYEMYSIKKLDELKDEWQKQIEEQIKQNQAMQGQQIIVPTGNMKEQINKQMINRRGGLGFLSGGKGEG